jgi:hypothetical protein
MPSRINVVQKPRDLFLWLLMGLFIELQRLGVGVPQDLVFEIGSRGEKH